MSHHDFYILFLIALLDVSPYFQIFRERKIKLHVQVLGIAHGKENELFDRYQ